VGLPPVQLARLLRLLLLRPISARHGVLRRGVLKTRLVHRALE